MPSLSAFCIPAAGAKFADETDSTQPHEMTPGLNVYQDAAGTLELCIQGRGRIDGRTKPARNLTAAATLTKAQARMLRRALNDFIDG